MSSPYYNRLQSAISKYRELIEGTIKDLRRSFIIDIVFIVAIPLILSLVALKWSGIAGFLTTIGLGGINAVDRIRRGQTILKSYWGERAKLGKSVKRLELELVLCDPTDTECLKKVESLLRGYLDALTPE